MLEEGKNREIIHVKLETAALQRVYKESHSRKRRRSESDAPSIGERFFGMFLQVCSLIAHFTPFHRISRNQNTHHV